MKKLPSYFEPNLRFNDEDGDQAYNCLVFAFSEPRDRTEFHNALQRRNTIEIQFREIPSVARPSRQRSR